MGAKAQSFDVGVRICVKSNHTWVITEGWWDWEFQTGCSGRAQVFAKDAIFICFEFPVGE
jgi:hypothetical protein